MSSESTEKGSGRHPLLSSSLALSKEQSEGLQAFKVKAKEAVKDSTGRRHTKDCLEAIAPAFDMRFAQFAHIWHSERNAEAVIRDMYQGTGMDLVHVFPRTVKSLANYYKGNVMKTELIQFFLNTAAAHPTPDDQLVVVFKLRSGKKWVLTTLTSPLTVPFNVRMFIPTGRVNIQLMSLELFIEERGVHNV